MKSYYYAILGLRVVDWLRHDKFKLWAGIEKCQAKGRLEEFIWSEKEIPRELKAHPLIGNTLCGIRRLFNKGKLSSLPSPLLPVMGNVSRWIRMFATMDTWPSAATVRQGTDGVMTAILGSPSNFFRLSPHRTRSNGT